MHHGDLTLYLWGRRPCGPSAPFTFLPPVRLMKNWLLLPYDQIF